MFKKISKKNYKLFSFYVIIAGIAALIDFSSLYYLTEYQGINYFYSNFISYSLGMLINFTLNKKFNFKNKSKRIFSQFALFASVALVGLALNQIIIFMLVEYLNIWYMYAKVIAVALVAIWSVYGHKRLTFGVIK